MCMAINLIWQRLATARSRSELPDRASSRVRYQKKRAANRLRATRKRYGLSTGRHAHGAWLYLLGSTQVQLV
jgi:hypothetical protein